MKKNKISNFFLILILISLLVSLINANYNIKHYDKNVLNEEGDSYHLMIKNDAHRYFSHGYEIKQQLNQNYNYFETGRDNFTKYLFPRIIAYYYKIFDYKLYKNDESKVVNLGIHKNFLVFQTLFYYLSVLFLYYQVRNKIKNNFLFFSLLFLCLEPTIFQYHSSFWSESIFFSLQILILALILNSRFSNFRLFLIGILLSLLALQRTNGFYYLLPVLIYFYFSKEFNFIKKISSLLIGFILVMSIVGYDNYKKSGKFFITPTETKSVLNAYVVPNIIDEQELSLEKDRFIDFLKNNNFATDYDFLENRTYPRYAFIFCSDTPEKNDIKVNYKICDYFDKRSKEIIFSHPLETIRLIFRNSLSFSLLNPFHIYSDYKFSSGEKYYESDLHQKILPYRIIYTLVIFFICFVGMTHMIKTKNYKLLFYLLISIVYFFTILSWHGNNRYFTPVLIYLSFFFGYGVVSIVNFFSRTSKEIQ